MPFLFLLFFFLLLFQTPSFPAKTQPPISISVSSNTHNPWRNFSKFIDLERGSSVPGISQLKEYLSHFGYLTSEEVSSTGDAFDSILESAVVSYQRNLGLPITGKLDSRTLHHIMSPRCGVSDTAPRKLAYFAGQPRWMKPTPMTLSYAFSRGHNTEYLKQDEVRAVFQRAFSRWSAVIPVNFREVADYETAEVKIGFFVGEHGDGEAFDGVLGVLGHAFWPENGRLHLDGAETWAVDFEKEKSSVAVDLESVATHEIGHVLGLAHSSVKEAVMYPNLSPRIRKMDLRVDDVEGVQALYGSNPNFNFTSLTSSATSNYHPAAFHLILPFFPLSTPLIAFLLFFFFFFIDISRPHEIT